MVESFFCDEKLLSPNFVNHPTGEALCDHFGVESKLRKLVVEMAQMVSTCCFMNNGRNGRAHQGVKELDLF
jgi:hypothetical protein